MPNSEQHHDPELERRFFEVVSEIEPTMSIAEEAKLILDEVESFRASATEATIPRPLRQRLVELIWPPAPLHERLVELESMHGGRIFSQVKPGAQYRFWALNGYWYFEEQHPTEGSYVISYEVSDVVHKTVNGKIAPFTKGELEQFLMAARKYRDVVRDRIYPVDAILAELEAEEPEFKNKSDYDLAA